MHIRSALLGFSLAGLFPLAGHTAFVDEGESFTDTDTGLRWVKATTTRGMTVEEVRAEMNATGQFAACRWPTGDEVQELFDNLGLPPSGTPVAGQDAEDLEFAIALLGDTLDGYLDNRADEDDVSPTGAGWTKANFGRSLLSSSSSGTILLRDGELVSRADGTPVSDGADEVFVSVPYGPVWNGDGDAGILALCPNWPAKPLTAQTLDFTAVPAGTTAPFIVGGYVVEGDATVLEFNGNKMLGSEACSNCQGTGTWTTSITISRLDGMPFALFDVEDLASLGNCDDGVSNTNSLYGSDEYWRRDCTWRGITTSGEETYFAYSPQEQYNEWYMGNGPWLNLQSLTIRATCGTGAGYEGYGCSSPYPARILLDKLEVADAVPVELDYNPWSAADLIDPTNANNPLVTVQVATTSIADGDAVNFDAADVDADTLSLARGGIAGWNGARLAAAPITHDLDGDGDTDYVFGFRTLDTGISCIDQQLVLSGQTNSGVPFSAPVNVNMVPGCFLQLNAALDVEPFDAQNRVYPEENYQVLVKLNDLPNFAPEGIGSGVRLGRNLAIPRDMIKDGPSNIDFEPIYLFDMQDSGITCDDTEVDVIGLYSTRQYVNGTWVTTPAFPSGEPAFKATASIQAEDCDTGCHP